MTYKTKSITAKKKAFTLIELLIVIAIIGILFIVLISKVNFATDKAKATGVQTDFRSFQVAIETVAKEKAGLATFGWDIGDVNGDRIRNSYDKGDTNQNGVQDEGEVFIGSKTYGEEWTNVYTLTNPADANDMSAIAALEAAINANLDPKLHITIHDDLTITMANGAQDPWNTEYHGYYITNATTDGKDRGAIVIYSNGANQEWGSEHGITNGVVTVNVPGNNVYGKDDYSLAVVYTYANGYGEVKTTTTGFSNNQATQGNISNNSGTEGTEGTEDPDITELLEPGLYSAGAIELAKAGDIEAAHDMLKISWDDLLAAGVVYVTNGAVYSNGDFYTGENASSDALDGDLVLPNDGSVTSVGDFVYNEYYDDYIGNIAFGFCDKLTGIAIPKSVTIITAGAFDYCTSLTSVTIPYGVTSISEGAFQGCTSLTSIVIPNSVKSIGDYAFAACESLLNVTINDQLEEMGYASFGGCISLESITLPFTGIHKDGFSEEESINNLFGYIFGTQYYDGSVQVVQTWYQLGQNITVYLPASLKTVTITGNKVQSFAFTGCQLENVIIGDKVEVIETAAFFDSYLTNVTIGSNLKATGDGAFMCSTQNVYLTNLAGWCSVDFGNFDGHPATDLIYVNGELLSDMVNLVIPDGVTHIGTRALSRCNNLTSVTIPSSVTSIGSWPFYDSNIENVYISDLAAWCNIESGWERSSGTKLYLNGNEIVGDVVLPEGIERVGYNALYYCDQITSITIPSTVTTIDESAFEYCTSLKSVTFANNSQLKIIGRDAFSHTGLTSFTIPDGVTTIGLFAFSYCNNLTSLVVPNSVSSVGQDPCIGCENLNVYITDMKAWCNISSNWGSLCGDSGNLYLNNELVTNLVIPDGVTSINDCAFEGCASIVSVTIPNSVQVIGFHAFYDCINLESIMIGNGLQEIGSWVFTNCTSLKTIRIESPIVVAADMYFFLPSNLTAIYVNSNLVDQYRTAYRWKDVASKIQAIPTT